MDILIVIGIMVGIILGIFILYLFTKFLENHEKIEDILIYIVAIIFAIIIILCILALLFIVSYQIAVYFELIDPFLNWE